MPVRLVSESAWHSAFMHNMFIRSHRDSLSTHVPEFTILHAPTMTVDPKEYGVNSEVFVVISLSRGIVLIGGTRYAGEIKKSIFTIMNHILPSRGGLLPMHCSANTSGDESALFFDFQELERPHFLQIREENWWGMTNTDGQIREYSISRVVAMPR